MRDETENPKMADEYGFSNAAQGVAYTKHKERAFVAWNAPDVAKVFPDSGAVNKGLRILIKLDLDGKIDLKGALRDHNAGGMSK